jgi:hypothetical protein
MSRKKELPFSTLVGKVLARVTETRTTLDFVDTDGKTYLLYHDPDCCESVQIEDVAGNLDDLIGTPILDATESTNRDNPPEGSESHTWTFYRLTTIKGTVVIRWLGESNGYYSEGVDFVETTP